MKGLSEWSSKPKSMARSASLKLLVVLIVSIWKSETTGSTSRLMGSQSNKFKKRSAVLFRATEKTILKQRRLIPSKVLYLKTFDNYINLQMTSNGRLSSKERIDAALGGSRHQIDESRYEAEVSPYSFERSRSNIEEKDQRSKLYPGSV